MIYQKITRLLWKCGVAKSEVKTGVEHVVEPPSKKRRAKVTLPFNTWELHIAKDESGSPMEKFRIFVDSCHCCDKNFHTNKTWKHRQNKKAALCSWSLTTTIQSYSTTRSDHLYSWGIRNKSVQWRSVSRFARKLWTKQGEATGLRSGFGIVALTVTAYTLWITRGERNHTPMTPWHFCWRPRNEFRIWRTSTSSCLALLSTDLAIHKVTPATGWLRIPRLSLFKLN